MMEKKLVPKLRLKSFDSEWFVKKYNQIYTFYSTNSFSRSQLNYEVGKIKNIHYGDIHTKFATLFNIENETVPFVNPSINLSRIKDENYCKEGDLIIADASEDYKDIGKTIEITNINNQKLITGLHTFHARPNKFRMAIGFSGYLLQTWKIRRQVMTIAQGTKVLGLATKRLGNIKLIIPAFEEQQKIATFLSSVDKRIEQLHKKKTLLEDYKKGMMQKIFSQEVRFKNDDGNLFGSWSVEKIKNIGKTLNGLTGKTKNDFGDGKPYIQYKQIFDSSKINIKNCGFVNIKSNDKQTKIKYGDVFFTTSSETPDEIGTASVLLDVVEEMYLNSFCFGLRLDPIKISPNFSQFLFRSEPFRKKIIPLAQGSTRYNISKNSFVQLSIELPTIKEQNKIAEFLSAIDKKIELVQTQIDRTTAFKKGLLQQMFV